IVLLCHLGLTLEVDLLGGERPFRLALQFDFHLRQIDIVLFQLRLSPIGHGPAPSLFRKVVKFDCTIMSRTDQDLLRCREWCCLLSAAAWESRPAAFPKTVFVSIRLRRQRRTA